MRKLNYRQFVVALILSAVVLSFILPSSVSHANEMTTRRVRVRETINQSATYWCWQAYYPTIEEFVEAIKSHGLNIDVELVGLFYKGDEHRRVLEYLVKNGFKDTCLYPYESNTAFDTGLNDPEHHVTNLTAILEAIELGNEFDMPNVIAFVGQRDGRTDEEAIANIRTALRSKYVKEGEDCKASLTVENGKLVEKGNTSVIEYAESMGVTIQLELLNSRVNVEMKGHPGYQGDSQKFMRRVVTAIASPALKELYDMYHGGEMGENVERDIETERDIIGHFHTAGINGRHEIDQCTVIDYRKMMEKIALYPKSYRDVVVTHEFIPRPGPNGAPAPDPFGSLVNAVVLCNIDI